MNRAPIVPNKLLSMCVSLLLLSLPVVFVTASVVAAAAAFFDKTFVSSARLFRRKICAAFIWILQDDPLSAAKCSQAPYVPVTGNESTDEDCAVLCSSRILASGCKVISPAEPSVIVILNKDPTVISWTPSPPPIVVWFIVLTGVCVLFFVLVLLLNAVLRVK